MLFRKPLKSLIFSILSISLYLAISVVTIRPACSESQEKKPVKIGLIFPLTGSMSAFGEDIVRALPLVEKRFNEAQAKYKFKLVLEDGKFGHTNAAITAAQKLVNIDGVKFLVVGSSGELLQLAYFVEKSKVLTVAGFASHPDVKSAGDYIFRTYVDAGKGAELVVHKLLEQKISRVALLTEESSFTSAILAVLENGLKDKIVFSESYPAGEVNLKTIIAKSRISKPEVYYLNVTSPVNFVNLVNQLVDQKIDRPLYTYYLPSLAEVRDSLGSKLNDTYYLDYPEIKEVTKDYLDLVKSLQENSALELKAPFNFRTNYNALKIIYDAILEVGISPENVKDFLYRYDRNSATGRLRFDKNGDVRDLNLVLKKFKMDNY